MSTRSSNLGARKFDDTDEKDDRADKDFVPLRVSTMYSRLISLFIYIFRGKDKDANSPVVTFANVAPTASFVPYCVGFSMTQYSFQLYSSLAEE